METPYKSNADKFEVPPRFKRHQDGSSSGTQSTPQPRQQQRGDKSQSNGDFELSMLNDSSCYMYIYIIDFIIN